MPYQPFNPETSRHEEAFTKEELLSTADDWSAIMRRVFTPGADPANGRLIVIRGIVTSDIVASGVHFNDTVQQGTNIDLNVHGGLLFRQRAHPDLHPSGNLAGWYTHSVAMVGDETLDRKVVRNPPVPPHNTGSPHWLKPGESAPFEYRHTETQVIEVKTNQWANGQQAYEPYLPEVCQLDFTGGMHLYIRPNTYGAPVRHNIVDGEGARIEWNELSFKITADWEFWQNTDVQAPRLPSAWPASVLAIRERMVEVLQGLTDPVMRVYFIAAVNKWVDDQNARYGHQPPMQHVS